MKNVFDKTKELLDELADPLQVVMGRAQNCMRLADEIHLGQLVEQMEKASDILKKVGRLVDAMELLTED